MWQPISSAPFDREFELAVQRKPCDPRPQVGAAATNRSRRKRANPLDFTVLVTINPGWRWESMDQDHEAEAERREERARTRDVDDAAKTPIIDPGRLNKAIRYLKKHPKQQFGQLQARISDFLRRT
jgi:hypothetical protein